MNVGTFSASISCFNILTSFTIFSKADSRALRRQGCLVFNEDISLFCAAWNFLSEPLEPLFSFLEDSPGWWVIVQSINSKVRRQGRTEYYSLYRELVRLVSFVTQAEYFVWSVDKIDRKAEKFQLITDYYDTTLRRSTKWHLDKVTDYKIHGFVSNSGNYLLQKVATILF